MKSQKVTVKIEVEVLDIAAMPAMLTAAANQITSQAENGHLEMNDGDQVRWNTNRKNVWF